jgi:hypothetical protein
MAKFLAGFLLLATVLNWGSRAISAQVVLQATRDNSMYSEAPMNSNGRGDHFIAGRAGGATSLRRGLLGFDLTGLPSAIRVDRVALELVFQGGTNMENDPRFVTMHRLLNNWGEGTSDSGPGGSSGSGNGAPATANDATWQYRNFNTQTWTSFNPAVSGSGGGDFVADASAGALVGIDPGVMVTWQTIRFVAGPPTGLVADVEHWRVNPSLNYGWLFKVADESPIRTARRFNSKDHPNAALRPRLIIDYTVVPEPATLALAFVAAFALARYGTHVRTSQPNV